MDCRALLFFAASARDQSPLWRSGTAASSILAGVRFGPLAYIAVFGCPLRCARRRQVVGSSKLAAPLIG